MVSGGLRWPAQFEATPQPAGSGAPAAFDSRGTIVAPELAIARFDLARVDFDIAGGRRCDPGRQVAAQPRQIRRLRRIFAGDRGIALVVLGDPVVETDRSHDRTTGTRRGAV